jgi:hypothetical protein
VNFDLSFNMDPPLTQPRCPAWLPTGVDYFNPTTDKLFQLLRAAREENHRRAGPAFSQVLPTAALFWSEVKVTTNGDDAASHSGGRGTNRSGGRDRSSAFAMLTERSIQRPFRTVATDL